MKSNKVLLGLFVGILTLGGSAISAQSTFHEVGPSNVGGHISSLVVDQRDSNQSTIYAGAIGGGLFVRSDNDEILEQLYTNLGRDVALASNHNTWHEVPCVIDGKQSTLPITTMVQGPDNTIYIGTGDNTFQVGSMYGRMSLLGKGIYRYNPEDASFTLVPGTKPTSLTHNFAAVKEIDYIYRDNKLYLFAVTNAGLYRWVINNSADWATAQPALVFPGEVGDLQIVRARRVAYFSVGNQLYKIGDITANSLSVQNCINVSASNSAFGGENVAIKLATSVTDPNYLYAMVIDKNGRMENIYLTTNEQVWTTLTTSTVTPMATGAGTQCGAMTVDPGNPQRIFIGGSTIWSGEGHLVGSYYQWTKSSYNENELNFGDYMSSVYGNVMAVHSGVHQILPVYANGEMIYYIATDGGVYTTNAFSFYENINSGLNTIQTNHIAVSPDGTIVSGNVSNSVALIEARLAHNAVNTEPVWYDNSSRSNFNHDANIIFTGNGGHVAASMFQQVKPQNRRQVIMSTNEGDYGRAYADYLDYTNTQTWTYNKDFVTSTYAGNYPMNLGNIYLWETTNNTIFDDTITVSLDTLGYILRRNSTNGVYDTVWMGLNGMTTGGVLVRDEDGHVIDTLPVGSGHGANFQIRTGDKTLFTSRAHSDYPFEYTFTRNQLAGESLELRNPIQARGLLIGRDSNSSNTWRVSISPRITDFTKVYNANMGYASQILWYNIYEAQTSTTVVEGMEDESGYRPRDVSMSSDGRFVYIAVNDIKNNQSMVIRVRGFENAKYNCVTNNDYRDLSQQLSAPRGTLPDGTLLNSVTILSHDTLRVAGEKKFARQISSIRTDTIGNTERLIITFEGYSNAYPNVAIVEDCTSDNWSVSTASITGHSDIPAFCSMVERTTGDIYIGTTDGVFYRHGNVWAPYEELEGVAVTSMQQQQASFPVVHHLDHNGINPINYVFAKTKWPNAMYFGTYGRGIFVDMKYVTDTVNEVADSTDLLDIPTVVGSVVNNVTVYPNPVYGDAHLVLNNSVAGNATLRIYDLNGRCVSVRQLGTVAAGEQTFTISTEGLSKGMYLINVTLGGHTSVAKMLVR